MDTTRLDVFAMDPITLRWVQAELTIGMDWYTRCVTGIRLTPVSTKSVDAAAVLYQSYRPRPAGKNWPTHAVWPEHGVPRSVLVDVQAVDGTFVGAAGPAIVPETVVIDHGKIYVSEHMTSVCQRLGISIQPARLRTGRDKGPVERFFRTIREDLLQILPGYKGPDIHCEGSTRSRRRSSILTSWKRSSASGWQWSITADRMTVSSIRMCQGYVCPRHRCLNTALLAPATSRRHVIPIWRTSS